VDLSVAPATVRRVTEPAYLAAVRDSYDTVVAAYVERVPPPAGMDPYSRAFLSAFAELVREGPVADLGCGPGRITAHLAGLGLSAFGVDVSPKMVEQATRAFPHLRFTVGSMTALDVESEALRGILAWYSTYHTPPDWLPVIFAEFHRTLAPGGHLLLGTYHGAGEHVRATRGYGGLPVSYESYLLPLDHIVALLAAQDLTVTAQLVLPPDPGKKYSSAFLLARRPE
jgi:SAM-dependent methyltransferase